MRKVFVLVLALLALTAVSCGGDDEEATPTQTAGAGTETSGGPDVTGLTKEPGILTVGAEPPAPPFIIPPYPDNPTGFEVDIAKEIGTRLGLETQFMEFVWTNLFSPAPKPFDFDINETTITEERDQVVDFSIPYFEANQAVLVHQGTDAENVASTADVAGLLLGAQEATTGLSYIRKTIKPSQTERVFPTTAAANQALLNETIDAFIIDLPIAAGLVGENPDELVVVGQFITNEEWGIVFEDGSPMVEPVNQVLQEMIDDGTLAELQDKWLPGTTDVPELQ
jgi:polar amino acid transport system substrate-binding protein